MNLYPIGNRAGPISASTVSLPIPRNTKQYHPGRQSWLGACLCRLTGPRTQSFSFDLTVKDRILITSHHTLYRWVEFVTIQQRFADRNSVKKDFSLWHPYIELLYVRSLVQVVSKYFLPNVYIMGNRNSARMMTRLHDFYYFIDFIDYYKNYLLHKNYRKEIDESEIVLD